MRTVSALFRLFTAIAWGSVTALGFAAPLAASVVDVQVHGTAIERELPDRAILGHNFSFPSRAHETWNPATEAFKQPFWDRFSATNPGVLRYPGGNWCYGFHFNLAREGIPHWVNGGVVNPLFRPQDLLGMFHALPDARALVHLSPNWSSPEEAAAFVAYLIGSPADTRTIGVDSWGRIDPDTGQVLDWGGVGDWAELREADGQTAYAGTLYFQVGNEDWSQWCGDRVCSGVTDYYGRLRPKSQMAVEDQDLTDPISGVRVEAYWPNYRDTYLKIRKFFGPGQVKVGAVVLAKPDGKGGADSFFRTAGKGGKRWNVALLEHLNNNLDGVTADFVTLHTYMYDKNGWEIDFPNEGAANILFASDHLAARIDTIFRYAKSPHYPVMVTEFNVHMHGGIEPSSLLSALFYVDYTTSALHNGDIIGMMRWQTANRRQHEGFTGESLFATDGPAYDRKIWKMGPYYAAKLMGQLHRRVLATTVEYAPIFRPHDLTGRWTAARESTPWWSPSDLPVVTVTATLSDDGNELALLILNKQTDEGFDTHLSLVGFVPEGTYRRSVLNTTAVTDHDDIFQINPWRLPAGGSCTPVDGGCTLDLAPEAGEQVGLRESTLADASEDFFVNVPPHSATLLVLTRRN